MFFLSLGVGREVVRVLNFLWCFVVIFVCRIGLLVGWLCLLCLRLVMMGYLFEVMIELGGV